MADFEEYHRNFPIAEMTNEQRGKMYLLDVLIVKSKHKYSDGDITVVRGDEFPLEVLRFRESKYQTWFKTVESAITAVLDTENYIWM